MIEKVKLTNSEIAELHTKGASLDPIYFKLEEIINSGMHVGLAIQED